LWVAEILRPEILTDGPDLDENLAPFLSIGESEVKFARIKAAELERGLRNEEEGCFRTRLFDMVEPLGSPWPCGRCSICIAAGEHPRTRLDKHEFSIPWSDQVWLRQCCLGGGARVINPEEPALVPHLDRLVARLAGVGIEQFVTTGGMLESLERSVCSTRVDLGFTLLLGGDVPPARVPTAVLIGSGIMELETVRVHCLTLRSQFEAWRELPLLFVLSPDLSGIGATLSQHLSSQAPMAEHELTRNGSCT
jgi:hypothetical protein